MERKFGREDLSDPLEMREESMEGTQSSIELRVGLGIGFRGEEGEVKI